MAEKSNVTLRTIAKAAGVCPMTVSLALRNSSSVSEKRRHEIQALAEKLGYRPDPVVSKLMSHLGSRRTARVKSAICILSLSPRGGMTPYAMQQLEAMRERGESLGYSTLIYHIDDYSSQTLARVLKSRGVEAVVVLPTPEITRLDGLLPWENFASVVTSFSVTSPPFHRVVPDQFGHMLMAHDELVKRGYRRIGLATSTFMDNRVRHHMTAAMLWHLKYRGGAVVEPLLDTDLSLPSLERWLKRERPDVIITESPHRLIDTLGTRRALLPHLVSIALLPDTTKEVIARIDQHPEMIGASAVQLVAAMVQRGEKGIPTICKTVTIEGSWVPMAPADRPAAHDAPAAAGGHGARGKKPTAIRPARSASSVNRRRRSTSAHTANKKLLSATQDARR